MRTVIYHNPRCGTSRNTLAMIRATGEDPEVILYLKTPPSRAALKALWDRAGLSVREGLRAKERVYKELKLDDPKWTDEQLLDHVEQHPILIQRPLVITDKGVALCRPSERVLALLARPLPEPFLKEDGERVQPRPVD